MATSPGQFRLEVSLGDASFSAEGDSELVMRAFETFRQDVVPTAAGSRVRRATEKEPDEVVDSDEGTSGNDGVGDSGANPHAAFAKGTQLAAFLTEKAPKTNDSAVAVMAVWGNANEGTTEFTVNAIGELWRRSSRKKPKNLPRDMKNAARKGWLDEAGRAKYTLPSYGIDYVRGLPDKE